MVRSPLPLLFLSSLILRNPLAQHKKFPISGKFSQSRSLMRHPLVQANGDEAVEAAWKQEDVPHLLWKRCSQGSRVAVSPARNESLQTAQSAAGGRAGSVCRREGRPQAQKLRASYSFRSPFAFPCANRGGGAGAAPQRAAPPRQPRWQRLVTASRARRCHRGGQRSPGTRGRPGGLRAPKQRRWWSGAPHCAWRGGRPEHTRNSREYGATEVRRACL